MFERIDDGDLASHLACHERRRALFARGK